MKKILFILSNDNIGGPQKSLLALLDKIDYSRFNVDLYVINSGGHLNQFFNDKVNIIKSNPLNLAYTLPSTKVLKHLTCMITNYKFSAAKDYIFSIIKNKILNKNMNYERQAFWKKHNKELLKLEDQYDIAFGILGTSTYMVVDLVDSVKKYHWVRSDSRILQRNQEIEAEYFERLNGSLSVSNECTNVFVEMYPFMQDKTYTFLNHIPTGFYEKLEHDSELMRKDNKSQINILTVTRLDPLKGIEMAIDACERLVKKKYNIKWYVLGGGKFKKEIEKMIEEKQLNNHFILLGFQLNTLSFIKQCDVFVHPSRTEGKSNAVDEAKYVGKPIVVTNYDTVRDQINHNETGLICKMSGESIAESVEKLLLNDALSNQLSINCEGRLDGSEVNNFLWSL
ncbi:glycosyltransferase [Exiguobacterium sp. S90]|uniref:glycosyltransferase n=1 Tax=Exiguobacterium sp. S90 TaxID=1221231 RepID=UPI001BE79C66|nr:glycosyltransferase [Exiguobacterium sp. S90]